jgi:hypothetical protein
MIKPEEVKARNENVTPYEAQIDDTLSAAWNDEMKQKGRRVSLYIPASLANACGVLPTPNSVQLEILRRKYQAAGWVFRDDPKQSDVWVFEYPKGKTP